MPSWQNIRGRKLVQWAIAYLAAAWVVFQVVLALGGTYGWPPVMARVTPVVLGIGFFAVLVLAWYHGERGEQRVSGVELGLLAGLLVLAGIAVAYVGRDAAEPAAEEARVPIPERSIAVLPLDNLSADPENEYFSDGVTEEILTTLSRIEGLKVISRTSVMAYKDSPKTLGQIASELGVATVLEGSVRREGNRVRVTVQLIDAATDEHLWSESYDRELTDIFAIQSDIASQIARALEARLTAEDRARLAEAPTDNLEAYELYLRGRFFWNKRSEENLRKAIDYYEQALELDPELALAHVGIAETWAVLPGYARVDLEDAVRAAVVSAERALELDPGLGQAYAALGLAHLNDWNWAEAERSFRRAIELNPGYASAHQWYALYLIAVGRVDEGIEEMRLAAELDPLSLIIVTEVGLAYYFHHRYDEAIAWAERALELDRGFSFGYVVIISAYEMSGRYERAIDAQERLGEINPSTATRASELRRAYEEGGARGYWRKRLEIAGQRGTSASARARIHAHLGEKDEAFAALERAFEQPDFSLTYLGVEPEYDPLRSDPRFDRLLERMGLPQSGRS